ncbi:hypothetical protein V6N11_045380 [Hibiscus sabdariffa]|uniref:Uncharacterized protein n=1 Tax=Hibiscus sabdariffa TaxID=183260 RepID=A0ABR2Q0S6_9ROSI
MDLITASREHLEFAKCSTFGHSEKFCPLAQQKERDLEWRAKKGNLSIVGVDQVITEAVVLDKSEAANVLMEAETIESTVEVTGYVVEAATDVVVGVVTMDMANVAVGKLLFPLMIFLLYRVLI